MIARSMLEEITKTKGGSPELTSETLELATQYRWPGNVRQLRNELLRCAARAQHHDRTPTIRRGARRSDPDTIRSNPTIPDEPPDAGWRLRAPDHRGNVAFDERQPRAHCVASRCHATDASAEARGGKAARSRGPTGAQPGKTNEAREVAGRIDEHDSSGEGRRARARAADQRAMMPTKIRTSGASRESWCRARVTAIEWRRGISLGQTASQTCALPQSVTPPGPMTVSQALRPC